MTTDRAQRAGLAVAAPIVAFVEDDALPGSGLDVDEFWSGFSALLADLTPRNRALLAERDRLQARIDDFHRAHPGQPDPVEYRSFLESIGYLRPEPGEFTITTAQVDTEITAQAGPQLVVPCSTPGSP